MKYVWAYCRDRKMYFLIAVFMCVVFGVVNVLYAAPYEASVYAFQICVVILLIAMLIDYKTFYEKHKNLINHSELKELYILEETPAKNTIEQDYQRLIHKLIQEKAELMENVQRSQTELMDYYAIWAHQIKTPIAAIDLLLQVMEENPGQVSVQELKAEMFKIDFYVEAVMNYLRLEDISSDFQFVQVSLKEVVNKAVKRFAGQFIHKKISITLGKLDKTVCTDEKWLGFIIEQLLSNAVKYTNTGGGVRIYLKETFNINDTVLVVEDNGIGISSEDLPRIMERGYTGYNGRGAKKSSGIGLYLCKKAADKLGVALTVESQPYIGTKVYISIEQNHTVHE